MRTRFTRMLLCTLLLGLVGCARSPEVVDGLPRFTELEAPMNQAVQALQTMEVNLRQGNPASMQETYKNFEAAFGDVLGPVSMKDPYLAQRMANADNRLQQALKQNPILMAKAVKEAKLLIDSLQEAAVTMGGSLMAAAPLHEGHEAHAHHGTDASPSRRVFTFTAKDFHFEPNRLEINAGETVTIRLVNAGTHNHEWEIEALDFELGPIPPGSTREAALKIDKPGTYEFICGVDDHAERGMRGTLIVK